MRPALPPGLVLHHGFLDAAAQRALVAALREVAVAAPPRRMETRGGRRMSVAMTAAGRLGWMSGACGRLQEPFRLPPRALAAAFGATSPASRE